MYRDQLPSLSGTIHSFLFPFANFTSYKAVHLYLINDNWNCKMSRFFCFVSIFVVFSVSKIMSCERFFLCQKIVFTRHLSSSATNPLTFSSCQRLLPTYSLSFVSLPALENDRCATNLFYLNTFSINFIISKWRH